MVAKNKYRFIIISLCLIVSLAILNFLNAQEKSTPTKNLDFPDKKEASKIPSLEDNLIPYKEIETPSISIWKVVGSTIIVIFLILGFGYLYKFLISKSRNLYYVSKKMQIVDRLPLSPTRHILLISVGKKYLVLSATEKGINFITELPMEESETEPEIINIGEKIEITEVNKSETNNKSSFKDILKKFTSKFQRIDKLVK